MRADYLASLSFPLPHSALKVEPPSYQALSRSQGRALGLLSRSKGPNKPLSFANDMTSVFWYSDRLQTQLFLPLFSWTVCLTPLVL